MPAVQLEGFGGGGAGLNFKVVGDETQPASATKNTIWVNTDVPLTSYIFSATEPEAPADGMVWITIGTESGVKFNALKKNGLQVYPISAKQYIGGVWVDKTAKSYQNGEWVDWVCVVYDSATGVENTSLLGEGGFSVITRQQDGKGTVTRTEDGITLNSAGSSNVIYLSHPNAIDFTRFKKVHVIWSGAYNSARITCAVHSTNKPTDTNNSIASVTRTTAGEYESFFEIGDVTGYIVLSAYNSDVNFKKIRMD